MNDYIATNFHQIQEHKNALQVLMNRLQAANDARTKERIGNDIRGKKRDLYNAVEQLLNVSITEGYWAYRQKLFAVALYHIKNNDLKSEYEDLMGKWRNIVLLKGNDALVIKSLASAGVKDFFEVHFKTPAVEKKALPPYSFFLQFQFTLAKPYISKDDKVLYPVENPVRKDKISGMPVIEAGSWKGNMRWTARKSIEMAAGLTEEEKAAKIKKLAGLFGNEKGDEENFRQGRLHFYPTFFEKISLEMINPHERKTKAGKLPVYIETVPAGAKGKFSLLYFPFDLVGLSPEDIKVQLADDFARIPKAIRQMMRLYGFSAKKSSGFGVTGPQLEEGIMRTKHFTDDYTFSNFNQMEEGFKQLLQEVAANVGR